MSPAGRGGDRERPCGTRHHRFIASAASKEVRTCGRLLAPAAEGDSLATARGEGPERFTAEGEGAVHARGPESSRSVGVNSTKLIGAGVASREHVPAEPGSGSPIEVPESAGK